MLQDEVEDSPVLVFEVETNFEADDDDNNQKVIKRSK